jgi:hypothetical protein
MKEPPLDGAFEEAVFSLKNGPKRPVVDSITGVFRGPMFTDEYIG